MSPSMLLPLVVTVALAAGAQAQTPPPAPPPPAAHGRKAPPVPPPPSPGAGLGKRQGDWPERPSGKTVTLTDRTTVDDALEEIAKAAGWNLVANTGRLGDRAVVLGLRDVPVEAAVDAVLEGLPLVAVRRGDVVTVAPAPLGGGPERPVLSGFDHPTGKRFSGKFTDTPVDDALRKVAEAAGLSIVLPPGLRGTLSAEFRDAPVEDVLRVILGQNGLSAEREGSIVTVNRTSGPSLVFRGGKRSIEFRVPDVDAEVGQALRDAERDVRQAEKEAAREARDAAREAGRSGRGGKHRAEHVLSGDQVIGPGQRVGEVVVLRGNLRMEAGSSAQQVTVILGSIELAPGVSVEDNAVAVGGDIHVSSGAAVGGDAVAVGGKIVLDEGGEIEGEHTSVSIPGLATALGAFGVAPWLAGASPAARLFHGIVLFVTLFLLGLLLITIAPRRVDGVGVALERAPVKSLLAGLLGTIAMPVLGLLLVVTVIGIPLVAVQVLAVIVAGILGLTGLAMLVGRAFPLQVERRLPVVQLAIGVAAIVLVTRLPVLGALAWVAAWLFAFGAVLRTRFGQPSPVLETALPTTAQRPPPMPPTAPPPAA